MSFRGAATIYAADPWKSRAALQEQVCSYPCQEAHGPQGKCRWKFASLGPPAPALWRLIADTTEHSTRVHTGKLLVATATASAVQVPGRCLAEWFPWHLPEVPLPLQSRAISMPMGSRGLSASCNETLGQASSTGELCAIIYLPLHIGPASNPVAISRIILTARILYLVRCFCASCVQSECSHQSLLSSDWLSALLCCMDLSYRGQLFARIYKKQDKERTFQHCISSVYMVIASSSFAAVASGTARAFLGENQYSFLMLCVIDLWCFI